jgi:hypothetical protein
MESHTNYVTYSPGLQAVTFSMLLSSAIGVVSYRIASGSSTTTTTTTTTTDRPPTLE